MLPTGGIAVPEIWRAVALKRLKPKDLVSMGLLPAGGARLPEKTSRGARGSLAAASLRLGAAAGSRAKRCRRCHAASMAPLKLRQLWELQRARVLASAELMGQAW